MWCGNICGAGHREGSTRGPLRGRWRTARVRWRSDRGLVVDHSTNERVPSDPSPEPSSSWSFYLSHDAFNNIQAKISRINQLLHKTHSEHKEDAGGSRPQPVTSSESCTLIGQFPSRHAIFRSNPQKRERERWFPNNGRCLAFMSGWMVLDTLLFGFTRENIASLSLEGRSK